MKTNKRVYISAPISGYDLEERKSVFADVEQRLIAKGYEVCNPMKNGLPDESPTQAHMKRDIEMLLTCDAILLLKGWNRSAGCKCELDVAVAIGLDVWLEEIQQKTFEYYIARDKDNSLGLYNGLEPERLETYFRPNPYGESDFYEIDSDLFPEVTFENSPKKVKIELV